VLFWKFRILKTWGQHPHNAVTVYQFCAEIKIETKFVFFYSFIFNIMALQKSIFVIKSWILWETVSFCQKKILLWTVQYTWLCHQKLLPRKLFQFNKISPQVGWGAIEDRKGIYNSQKVFYSSNWFIASYRWWNKIVNKGWVQFCFHLNAGSENQNRSERKKENLFFSRAAKFESLIIFRFLKSFFSVKILANCPNLTIGSKDFSVQKGHHDLNGNDKRIWQSLFLFDRNYLTHILKAVRMNKKNLACQLEQKLSCVAITFSRWAKVKITILYFNTKKNHI